ncbi:GNAT family N-acetyltransferase [Myceligenerans crystallogenes]|uniref:GNAT family N-acetyltransferase n=1 Tax=Myceligenerans crystallogenes TaxID=316335 RepID=A0ABP5A0W3_9MICO
MRLRTARMSDAATGARIHHEMWVSTYGDMLPASFWESHTLEKRETAWRRHLALGWKPVLAEAGGEVVGFAHAEQARTQHGVVPARERQLFMLYVLAEHHGTGVGQALLDAATPPGEPCQLWVAEDNPRARRFYERNGFVADGARINDENFPGITELRMVR